MPLAIMKSPQSIVWLELQLVKPFLDHPDRIDRLLFRTELCIHRYSFAGFKFSCGIPTEFVYEGLMVLPDLACTDDGEMFQTASLPIPFDVFCR